MSNPKTESSEGTTSSSTDKAEPEVNVEQSTEVFEPKLQNAPLPPLSKQETKLVLTPFAFEVDNSLMGTPLAKPWKRGLAMGIDAFLIVLLTNLSSAFLAILAAATFFKVSEGKGKKRKTFFRLLTSIIIFSMVMEFGGQLKDGFKGEEPASLDVNTSQVLSATLKYVNSASKLADKIENQACGASCYMPFLTELVTDLEKQKLSKEQAREVTEKVVEAIEDKGGIEINPNEINSILENVYGSKTVKLEEGTNELLQSKPELNSKLTSELKNAESNLNTPAKPEVQQKETTPDGVLPSIIALSQGIIQDLGLGFGWAAFYFTLFTAWWTGQTPGKKVAGIKVLQLDGTPLSLWDAFGRYGGYAAGFATGLLGFLQIIWDPNRQAIQDKISATVVIDLKVKKSHSVFDSTNK